MGYSPIFDGSFDVAIESFSELSALIASVVDRKMIITNYKPNGGAGHPEITMRGTRVQIVSWIDEYYAGEVMLPTGSFEKTSNAEIWIEYVDTYGIKFVA